MKYSLDYNRYSKILYQLDEINIKCDPEDLDILFDYIKEHKHQRINVRIDSEEDILDFNLFEEFSNFQSENHISNMVIILPEYNLNFAAICKEKKLKFFIDLVVRDWETFHAVIDLGVSDVYLIEQMMFEIKEAAAAAHASNVRVRTFPNIAQRRYESTPALKTFFIRPEDIIYYEGYVDTMEIYSIPELNQDVLFEIYAKDHQWWGPLKEIIVGLDNEIDGKYIIPRFGERRLNCKRKCFKGEHCDICETTEILGKNLQKAGLLIQYERMKDKEDEIDGKRSKLKDTSSSTDSENI